MSIASTAIRVEIPNGEYLVLVVDQSWGRDYAILEMSPDHRCPGIVDMGEIEGWQYFVTDAPASYDYGGTLELDPEYATGNNRTYRLIAIRENCPSMGIADQEYQFPRYHSGLYSSTDRKTFHMMRESMRIEIHPRYDHYERHLQEG